MYKVLHLVPSPFFADRGCHVRIYEEFISLNTFGAKQIIVTYHLGLDVPGVETRRIRNFGWYQKLSAGPSLHKIYLDAFLLNKALKIAAAFKPDIIHAHLHEGCAIGAWIKKKIGVPLVFDYQGSLTAESINHGFIKERSASAALLRNIEGRINAFADAVLFSASCLIESYIGAKSSDRLIPLGDGVDPQRFRPLGRDENLLRELGLDPRIPIIGFLGLLNHYQGVDLLFETVGIIKSQGRRAQFLVMGYPDEDRYRALAAKLQIQESVFLPGRIDYFKAPLYLSQCDIAVAPKIATTEANGKVLNYMACGLPVAAFDTKVNREILGRNASYAELTPDLSRSAQNLAQAITRLLDDRSWCNSLAENGRRIVERDFRWDRIARKIMGVYQELIERAPQNKKNI